MATLRTREATQAQGENETSVEEELDEVTARALTLLRNQQPQLFDPRGRLRRGALRQFLLARAGGKQELTREEIDALSAAAAPGDGRR